MDNDAQLKATVNAAIRNNVVVLHGRPAVWWPKRPRATPASARQAGGATPACIGRSGTRARQSNSPGSQDTLYGLAADTGGKAFFDYNDSPWAVVQAQKDISSYYILGYYTGNTALDGKYRRIKVRIKSNLSAKLDYRTDTSPAKSSRSSIRPTARTNSRRLCNWATRLPI